MQEELQNRLNNAATKAGLPAGYALEHYTDNTDGYADYIGYTVEGPDVARAQTWLCTAIREGRKGKGTPTQARRAGPVTRYAEVRTVRSNGWVNGTKVQKEVTFVCYLRFSLGD
jgi:hypothetical protein